MVMQLNALEIQKQFHKNNIAIPQMYKTKNGKMAKHKVKDENSSNIECIISILILLYVDDAAVPFENRNNMIKGIKIIDNIMSKFGLTIHKGAG